MKKAVITIEDVLSDMAYAANRVTDPGAEAHLIRSMKVNVAFLKYLTEHGDVVVKASNKDALDYCREIDFLFKK
jgi:hypothetical protein